MVEIREAIQRLTMNLVKWKTFTQRHWQLGSRPSKQQCVEFILEGTWEGRIAGDMVWVDENHFLSSIIHKPPTVQKPSGIALLQ